MKKIFIVITIASLTFIACKGSKQTTTTTPTPAKVDCSTKMISYAVDIKPILEANCTNCHNTNNTGGYNFNTFQSAVKSGANGELLGTIKHSSGFPMMPPNGEKISQAEIDKIECWINNGMKD